MKIQPAIGLVALQMALLVSPARWPSGAAAAQNPFANLENAAKEKAAEEALTKVLNDNLPLTLNASDVYPTVTTLPGGPFSPKPLQLTADQLDQPLPPGDYTINTLDFCSQYSVHQPGAGTAYVLGPYEGKAAGAIGALIWRGTEQYNINPNSLQAVSWAIQSGLTYGQMPKSYQAIVDQVIPGHKTEITGDFVTNLENTYNSLAKTVNLPPLDTVLAKMGGPGQLALDAERQRRILTAQNTSDELKQQTLFQGQESGIYAPVKAESGPWSVRVPGQVYMKLLIAGGNMATNNVMQIRVMPSPATTARNAGGITKRGPHLVRAAYGGPQVTPAASDAPITLTSIMEGVLGYSMGKGAQALGQVAAVLKALNPITPAEAAELPAQCPAVPPNPSPTAVLQSYYNQIGALSASCANQVCTPAKGGNTSPPDVDFISCSGAISSQQLYTAYNSLYNGSPTFKCLMNQLTTKAHVLVVDGTNALGQYFQKLGTAGYNIQLRKTGNEGKGLAPATHSDWAYTMKDPSSGEIRTVIAAQNLLTHVYTTGYGPAPEGTVPDTDNCNTTGSPQTANEPVQQLLAYELGQNGSCESKVQCFKEQVDENRTNQIMQQLAGAQQPPISFAPNIAKDASNSCQVESGANDYDPKRALLYTLGKGGVVDFTQPTPLPSTPNPGSAEIYDTIKGDTHTTFSCNYSSAP